MENKKMTAVESLYEKMYIHKGLITTEEYNQALQMEKDQLAEKDKEIERLKDEKDEALRLLNDALKLIHSLPDLLHDSLGECSDGNDYEIISINGERWINHKVVGSGEPLKQWIKSEIDKALS